jgi:hypothetical protein
MAGNNQVAFPAFLHSVKVGMVYGDKEGTLVVKFRPEGTTIEDINPLVGNDQAVMVAIVPIANVNANNPVKDNERQTISKGRRGKSGRKAEGGEV